MSEDRPTGTETDGDGVAESEQISMRSRRSELETVGTVGLLMTVSPAHQHRHVHSLWTRVLPPARAGQYRVWVDSEGEPVGFVSWAFLREEAIARMREAPYDLLADDWIGGETAVVQDVVGPVAESVLLRLLKEQLFADRPLFVVERDTEGKALLVEVPGEKGEYPEEDPEGDPLDTGEEDPEEDPDEPTDTDGEAGRDPADRRET